MPNGIRNFRPIEVAGNGPYQLYPPQPQPGPQPPRGGRGWRYAAGAAALAGAGLLGCLLCSYCPSPRKEEAAEAAEIPHRAAEAAEIPPSDAIFFVDGYVSDLERDNLTLRHENGALAYTTYYFKGSPRYAGKIPDEKEKKELEKKYTKVRQTIVETGLTAQEMDDIRNNFENFTAIVLDISKRLRPDPRTGIWDYSGNIEKGVLYVDKGDVNFFDREQGKVCVKDLAQEIHVDCEGGFKPPTGEARRRNIQPIALPTPTPQPTAALQPSYPADAEISNLKGAFGELREDIDDVTQKVGNLTPRVSDLEETVYDDHGPRITRLEERVPSATSAQPDPYQFRPFESPLGPRIYATPWSRRPRRSGW